MVLLMAEVEETDADVNPVQVDSSVNSENNVNN